MISLEDFETKEDVDVSSVSPDVVTIILLWVHVWKGFVKSRLCARGYKQQVSSLGDTYASTPVIYVLRLLLIIALARRWMFHLFDISTAFLHAPLSSDDQIYVWPPSEFIHMDTLHGSSRSPCMVSDRLQRTGSLIGLEF